MRNVGRSFAGCLSRFDGELYGWMFVGVQDGETLGSSGYISPVPKGEGPGAPRVQDGALADGELRIGRRQQVSVALRRSELAG